MNLKFYEVDSEYIKYLRVNGDQKIPNIEYEKHKKFFCGIVLTINNFNYFAPVSSYNKKVHTSFLIMDKDRETKKLKAISSLRFSFMFPCPIEYEVSISTENNVLKVSTFENNKFFNTKVSKTEIYVPKTYDKLIEIKNNYGNVEIGEFENSTISIEEDYGNVKVENAKDITIQNNYGDISLGDAESATLNESCGDIKIKKLIKL